MTHQYCNKYLDCIDKFLKLNKRKHQHIFDEIQMIFIGNLKQLSPVIKKMWNIYLNPYKSSYFLSTHFLNVNYDSLY